MQIISQFAKKVFLETKNYLKKLKYLLEFNVVAKNAH